MQKSCLAHYSVVANCFQRCGPPIVRTADATKSDVYVRSGAAFGPCSAGGSERVCRSFYIMFRY